MFERINPPENPAYHRMLDCMDTHYFQAITIISKTYHITNKEAHDLGLCIAYSCLDFGSEEKHNTNVLDSLGLDILHMYALVDDKKAFEKELDRQRERAKENAFET